jgi:hypothetical protein
MPNLQKSLKSLQVKVNQIIPGILGLSDSLVNVPNRLGYSYVKLLGNSNELIQAYNTTVSPQYGVPVMVQWNGTQYVVLGRDVQRYTQWSNSAYLPLHGDTHQWMGGDTTWIHSEQFYPLSVSPSGSSLFIAPYTYNWLGNWIYGGNTGTNTIALPTGSSTQKIMLLYLDGPTGNPTWLPGAEAPLYTNVYQLLPYLPPFNMALGIPLAMVGIPSGTTSLEWGNLYDIRQFFGGSSAGTGSSGTGSYGIPEAPIDGSLYGRMNAGWSIVSGSSVGEAPNNGLAYVRQNDAWKPLEAASGYQASGGIESNTPDGLYHIHIFTGSNTLVVSAPITDAEVLVVAGGGGGGGMYGPGGGAGGLLHQTGRTLAISSKAIVIGGGGAQGATGQNSTFDGITALGGGAGGGNGGSGGGGGTATQGNSGGATGYGHDGGAPGSYSGGGGGGAGAVGANAVGMVGGAGGAGLQYDISGAPTAYATGGTGWSNGGGALPAGVNGTGGGGGAGSAGGSGIVIIKYLIAANTSVVFGPVSAVVDDLATFDGTTGKIIKDSGLTVTTTVTNPGVDTKVPTEKAVRTALSSLIGDANALVYKGVIDCSGNPNYPAADAGNVYIVSVAGKIGGSSGIVVNVGDMCLCNTDSTPSGDQATVGAYWNVIEVAGNYQAYSTILTTLAALANSSGWLKNDGSGGLSYTTPTAANVGAPGLVNPSVVGNFVSFSSTSGAQQDSGKSSSSFDTSGAASTVQGNLTTHIGLTGTSVHGLGTASTHASTDFAPAFVSGTANYVWATPNGSAGVPSLRALVATDIPALSYDASGAAATVQGNLTTHIGLTGTSVHGLGTLSTINDAASDGTIYGRKNGGWVAAATGTGNFTGPASSTAHHIVTFADTTGKVGEDSGHALSEYLTSVTAHNILSATHGDTLTDTVIRGDILYGNATPKWARLAKGGANAVLSGDGTDTAWSAYSITSGGSAYALTIPATGTVALVGINNFFSVDQTIHGALFSTFVGANSNGVNLWIGGGGQSAVGEVGATWKGSYNSAMGMQALYSNTTGYQNSAMGYAALFYNTTGYQNSAMGTLALFYNTTGYYNSAMGMQALYSNTTGYQNSAMGNAALFHNTTGYNNSAMGYAALYSNTTGYQNSAMGTLALFHNTTGYYNSAMGYAALNSNTTGSYNSAMGMQALYSNTTGSYNSAMGVNALNSNTTGYQNSAMGYAALNSNTTGYQNSAMGMYALYSNTTVSYNSAMGYAALYSNTTGYQNSAMGYAALYSNTTGYRNSAMGMYALLDLNITADDGSGNNTAVGYNTGRGIVTGVNNTIIGANVTGLASTLSNTVIIADGSGNQRIYVDSGGNVGIGTTSPGYALEVNGTFKANTTAPVFGAYTLTVPATGTAALLATANIFTATQAITLSAGQYGLNISATLDNTTSAFGINSVITSTGLGAIVEGIRNIVNFNQIGAGSGTLVIGTTSNVTVLATATRAISSMYGDLVTVNNSSTAGAVVTNAYGISISSPDTTGAITNLYGLYINNQTGAATLNYALYTNGGKIHFKSLPTSAAGLASGDIWEDTTGGLNILKVI